MPWLKNMLRQPLPLEYAGGSLSIPSRGKFFCEPAHMATGPIARNLSSKRLSVIDDPISDNEEVDKKSFEDVVLDDVPIIQDEVPNTSNEEQCNDNLTKDTILFDNEIGLIAMESDVPQDEGFTNDMHEDSMTTSQLEKELHELEQTETPKKRGRKKKS
jgi:hypothetical protein